MRKSRPAIIRCRRLWIAFITIAALLLLLVTTKIIGCVPAVVPTEKGFDKGNGSPQPVLLANTQKTSGLPLPGECNRLRAGLPPARPSRLLNQERSIKIAEKLRCDRAQVYGTCQPNTPKMPTGAANYRQSKTTAAPVSFTVTAYCPCELCTGPYCDGITASGHVIQPGDKFCAAPPEIPFGTLIGIPGYGVVPVLDRGGAIKGNKLDIYFDTHSEALAWGVRELKVRIHSK